MKSKGTHLKYLPKVGTVKGVYGAQRCMAVIHPKPQKYYNAIAISDSKLALCRKCSTPTDSRETGWVDGAPVIEQICPHCSTVYVPVVIEL